MNLFVGIGRLTRDPEIRSVQSGDTFARYTLAIDRMKKRDGSDGGADFINCVAFGKGASFAEKYLHKGTKIAVTGRIQTGSYTNREGRKVYTTDVIVSTQEFAEGKTQQAEGKAQEDDEGGFMNVSDALGDEDLPFN